MIDPILIDTSWLSAYCGTQEGSPWGPVDITHVKSDLGYSKEYPSILRVRLLGKILFDPQYANNTSTTISLIEIPILDPGLKHGMILSKTPIQKAITAHERLIRLKDVDDLYQNINPDHSETARKIIPGIIKYQYKKIKILLQNNTQNGG